MIDEILERCKNLQHLRAPQDMIAWKAVVDVLRVHNYVVTIRSLYEHLCARPIWAAKEAPDDDAPGS